MTTLWDKASAVRGGRILSALRKLVLGASFVGVGLLASPAWAQSQTYLLDRAQVSGAPDDGFMVIRPYQGDKTRFYMNGALGFSLNPLREDHVRSDLNEGGASPITSQFPVYLSGGLQVAGLLGFNLHIPFTPLQTTGREPIEAGTNGLTDTHSTMNDIRLDVRFRGWESNNRKTRIGAFGGFTIGTGTPVGFGGDGNSTAFLAVNAEHNFGSFLLTGHIGPHFRPRLWLGGTSDLFIGDELRYAVGAFLPFRDERLRLGVEVWGSTGLEAVNGESTFFKSRNTTFEWLGQARFLVSRDKRTYFNVGAGTRFTNGYGSANIRALVSIGRWWGFSDTKPKSPAERLVIHDKADYHAADSDGDGYPDDIDKCPQLKEDGKKPAPSDGCPAAPDADNDGIPDSIDKCPNDPEDFDGIQDKDGCPEDDADNDKVLDKVDKCPENPGPPNADASKNGCPVSIEIKSDGTVALLKPIQFAYGKSTIKRVSYPILKEVATLMAARPTITIAVQGHTDNAGSHAFNVKLSDGRASSVRKYLIAQGIKGSRLTSKGFGPDKPIDTNATDAGRAKNRRVEFVVEGGTGEEPSEDELWE